MDHSNVRAVLMCATGSTSALKLTKHWQSQWHTHPHSAHRRELVVFEFSFVFCITATGFCQHSFARQLHSILIVDSNHLNFHDVANLANFVDVLDEAVRQFTDVTKSVLARSDFNERPEVLD